MTFRSLCMILGQVNNVQGRFKHLSVGGAGMIISLDMECSVALDTIRTRCDIAHAIRSIASGPGESLQLGVFGQQVAHFEPEIHSHQSISLLEDLGAFTPFTPLPN
jgi:hypothetical protein